MWADTIKNIIPSRWAKALEFILFRCAEECSVRHKKCLLPKHHQRYTRQTNQNALSLSSKHSTTLSLYTWIASTLLMNTGSIYWNFRWTRLLLFSNSSRFLSLPLTLPVSNSLPLSLSLSLSLPLSLSLFFCPCPSVSALSFISLLLFFVFNLMHVLSCLVYTDPFSLHHLWNDANGGRVATTRTTTSTRCSSERKKAISASCLACEVTSYSSYTSHIAHSRRRVVFASRIFSVLFAYRPCHHCYYFRWLRTIFLPSAIRHRACVHLQSAQSHPNEYTYPIRYVHRTLLYMRCAPPHSGLSSYKQ